MLGVREPDKENCVPIVCFGFLEVGLTGRERIKGENDIVVQEPG